MATGIVSVALHVAGRESFSRGLLVLTAIGWTLLGMIFLHRAVFSRNRWGGEARQPSSLTAVAGTAVLGVRVILLGWSGVGWVLLATATALSVALGGALRGERLPRTGAAFLVVVALQSLAGLAARLYVPWLGWFGLVVFLCGIAAYVIVLRRFDFAQLRSGMGDQWIAGGALAISTLTCAEVWQAFTRLRLQGGLDDVLRTGSLVLWVLTMLWLPALIGAEVMSIRRRYDVRRWATVFPLGMYSVMSFNVGTAVRTAWLVHFARAWSWVALGAWILTTIGAVCATRDVLRNGDSR